ncbi:MAG: NADH-quinone oxidoreductase subunit NuoN [Rickettsiella sp.]|nr:NADH-quinone oxidoreductase subunit NuoN [Rickettsiella sp.]
MLAQLFKFPALPEISLLGMICIVLLLELFVKQKQGLVTYIAAQISLLITFILVFCLHPLPAHVIFNQQFVWDPVAYVIKLALLSLSFFAFIYVRDSIRGKSINPGEFYLLGLFSILGMLILTSANSLLSLYLGLELLSFPLYALVALHRGCGNSAEAAMKYFILGALASGLFLYGLSLLYGSSHSLIIPAISQALLQGGQSPLILSIALIFIVAGIAFKLGAAPFQSWVPDVYEGAPTSVTLFIGAAPKVAGFAIIIRLLIEALPSLQSHWQPLLAIIAFLSFSLGNLVAIIQTNLKRMLAYSAIAHIGYTLLGLVAGTGLGYAMSLFYVFMYGLMALAAFGVLIIVSQAGYEIEKINDLRGLNARSPWLAFLMLLVMFSMAGIPPTVGFFAKMGILQALIAAHQLWLATLAIIFAIIGSYYYLTVVKVMYFEEPESTLPSLEVAQDAYLALSINAILLLVLGLFPSQLIWLTKAAFLTISHPVY